MVDWARTRTNRVSHALLSDLAHGSGPAPLHDLVKWLLEGEASGRTGGDALESAIDRLARLGHTSGWDLLAGLLTGGLLVAGAVAAIPRSLEEA